MAHQPQTAPLELGQQAPDFCLPATDGKEYSLSQTKGDKGTVIAFSCNHCPYVKAYDERMNELAKIYQSQGVAFFAVNSNDDVNYPDDSFERMQDKVRQMNLVYPYLRDATQQVARDFGAGCTPEFFVFNANLELAYTGRLDDNMEEPERVTQFYLKDAIEAVMAGQTPAVQQAHPIGCSVKWKS